MSGGFVGRVGGNGHNRCDGQQDQKDQRNQKPAHGPPTTSSILDQYSGNEPSPILKAASANVKKRAPVHRLMIVRTTVTVSLGYQASIPSTLNSDGCHAESGSRITEPNGRILDN